MRRWILLLLTVWPLLYMGVFAYLFVQAWITNDDAFFASWVIVGHVLAFTTMVALLVVYLRDLFRRDLPSDSQALWGVLMGVLGPLVMLPYWWRFIRPAGASSPSRPGAGSAQG